MKIFLLRFSYCVIPLKYSLNALTFWSGDTRGIRPVKHVTPAIKDGSLVLLCKTYRGPVQLGVITGKIDRLNKSRK